MIVSIYFYSFNSRDRNLDYKLSEPYQKSGNDEKLRTDIINGLKTTIKNEVIKNFSDPIIISKAIENLIDKRETAFLNNLDSLSKQYKISQNVTKDTVFLACDYVRDLYKTPFKSDNKIENHRSKKEEMPLSESIDFTKKQKLACNIFLGHIIHSTYKSNPELYKLYKKVERNQLEFLGLSIYETTDYLEWTQKNHSYYLETLRSLNETQKDFLVSMALELLCCNGLPVQDEYMKFESAFEKVLFISKDEFANKVIKINALVNKFS